VEKILYARALPVSSRAAPSDVARPWKPRIPEIIKDLQAVEVPYLTRSDIETKLEIKRSQADAVMRQVGFKAASEVGIPGKLNVVSRAEFITWLEVHYGAPARKEHDRLESLQKKLAAARGEQKLNSALQTDFKDKKQVADVIRGDIQDIPGVILEPPIDGKPGRFVILFANTIDFLGKLHLFGWSAVNQEEKLNQMTTPVTKVKPS
jgi:hypothetical protein